MRIPTATNSTRSSRNRRQFALATGHPLFKARFTSVSVAGCVGTLDREAPSALLPLLALEYAVSFVSVKQLFVEELGTGSPSPVSFTIPTICGTWASKWFK